MKKIFMIISGVLVAFVIVLLSVLTSVKKNIGFTIYNPKFINVYYGGTQSLNAKPYEENEEEYNIIMQDLTDMTTLSLFKLAQNNGNLNYKIEYDTENYATYDSSMKNEKIVVELIYTEIREVLVYEDKFSRVVPFRCLLFVIPLDGNFDEIIVYNALDNDNTKKEEQYKNCTPFILKGNAKKLISYAKTLKK